MLMQVLFCGWTNKRVMFWWSLKYFALTTDSELRWYDGTPQELKLGGKASWLVAYRLLFVAPPTSPSRWAR